MLKVLRTNLIYLMILTISKLLTNVIHYKVKNIIILHRNQMNIIILSHNLKLGTQLYATMLYIVNCTYSIYSLQIGYYYQALIYERLLHKTFNSIL
jgi:hypothetical protein